MKTRLTLAALALSFAAAACDRDAPTTANTAPEQPSADTKKGNRNDLVTNIPVTGTAVPITNPGAVPTAFSGTLTITRFAYNPATGQLLISGTITDAAGTTAPFTDHPINDLTSPGAAPTAAVCPILNLDVGAIRLDLLGLVVTLAPIDLDIVAVSGPGKLLGNLLCALVGLLDRVPPPVAAILDLIDRINRLLA
jgi:hypothetical protein